MSSIVWTTLPKSVDPVGGTATVSVYVTPRLTGTTLDYPMSKWASIASSATFALSLYNTTNSTTPVATVPATVLNGPFSDALWSAIFPSQGMAVVPFALKDNSTRQLWSYPVNVLHEDIKKTYASVQASSPTAFPVVDPLGFSGTAPSTLNAMIGSYATANQLRIETRLGNFQKNGTNWAAWNAAELAGLKNPAIGLTPVQVAAWLAKRFYDRPTTNKDIHGNRTDIAAIAAPPTYDFHQRLAILADHPWLMRQLGIVIDLQFSFADVGVNGASLPTPGFIKVVPSWDTTGQYPGYDITPRTAYELANVRFVARTGASTGAADADVGGGMLEIEDPSRFYVTQGDPDGTAHKVIDYASNMVSLAVSAQLEAGKANQAPAPANQSLPAQRSLGITVTRIGRAAALQSRFTRVASLHNSFVAGGGSSAAPLDLYAEDVLRGYRVDIGVGSDPATAQWASLHQRKVNYSIAGSSLSPNGPVYDEGYVKSASGTSDSDPTGPTDLYVHERLFAWHGWSLSASRPGQRILPDGSVGAPNNAPADPTFPVTSDVSVWPGTLPSMRYGMPYLVRARAVDLAANSLGLGDPGLTTAHVTLPQVIGRYEPVPPPVLVYPSGVTEGESIENVVIRSNPADGIDAGTMASHLNAAYSDPKNPLAFTDLGNGYKLYAANCDRHIAPPKEAQIFAEMHGDFDGAFFQNANVNAWYNLGLREEGTFMDRQIVSVADGSTSWNVNNPIIVTPPQVPMDQRRAVVPATNQTVTAARGDALAPGEYVICQPASGIVATPYLPDSLAGGGVMWDPTTNANVLKWTYGGGTGNDYSAWPDFGGLRVSLTAGAAVQYAPAAPALAPDGTVLSVALPPATILTLSYASTPRADRLGHLQYVNQYQPQDDITDGRHWMVSPSRAITFVHAVQRPLAPPTAVIDVNRDFNQTFVTHSVNLTSHSNSTGHVDVDGEWIEFIDDVTSPGPVEKITTGHAYQLTIAYGQDSLIERGPQHEFGDTKHRFLVYTPTGTTRYKEYFPPGIINDTTKITSVGTATPGDGGVVAGDLTVFNIPSSARPIAPKIEYVVPTFAWDPPTSVQSTRHGGGLRVYMDRPWYTSGQNEVVGVVLSLPASLTPAVQPFVSMWGRDPVWGSASNGTLTATAFKNAMGPAVQCVLAENGATVLVVPFAVQYHPGKKLWFCDIDMDPGQTYFPFVSLALVRYQPYSLTGVEISKVSRADFAQLLPDRTLNVTKGTGSLSISVTGVVADNIAGGYVPGPTGPQRRLPPGYVAAPTSHEIVATLQQRQAGSYGEMGWQSIGQEVTLTGIMTLNGGMATWSGTLAVPLATGAERRLLVEEVEYYLTDPPASPIGPGPINSKSVYTATRLVYIDTFPLT